MRLDGAADIEKNLNRMDGVTATVNYATEKAKVTFEGAVTPVDVIAEVEATGYSARVPGAGDATATTDDEDDETRASANAWSSRPCSRCR